MTPRDAKVGLALLASSGCFVTSQSLATVLDIPQHSIKVSVAALSHHARAEARQLMFIEYRQGYGYVLYGMGERLAEFEMECNKTIAKDKAAVSFADQQDAYAARIIRPRATPSSMIGCGG